MPFSTAESLYSYSGQNSGEAQNTPQAAKVAVFCNPLHWRGNLSSLDFVLLVSIFLLLCHFRPVGRPLARPCKKLFVGQDLVTRGHVCSNWPHNSEANAEYDVTKGSGCTCIADFLLGRERVMRLSYSDRETILHVFDGLKSERGQDEAKIVSEISKWANRLRPSVGFDNDLLRDITCLCHYLISSKDDDIKELARGALLYALNADDLIPDDLPLVGLQDDAFILGFAVHEIRSRLGETASYSPPRLTTGEQNAAKEMFQSFLERRIGDDETLIAESKNFCEHMGAFSGSGFFGRLCRNVQFLSSLLTSPAISADHRNLARAALSYLACKDDVIDDRLGLVGYLDDNFVVQTAVDLIEPGRDPWLDLLDSITEAWPFVNRCVLGESLAAYPLSEFQMVNSALSCNQLRSEGQTLQTALVLPFSGPTTTVLAFLAGLGVIQETVHGDVAAVSLRPGQRVMIDNDSNKIRVFGGFGEIGGRKMFSLKRGTESHWWPVCHLPRLTPVQEHRVPRGRIRIDQSRNDAPISALEQVFYLSSPVQFSNLKQRIIVVTRVAESHRCARETVIHGQRLSDIIPMGHVRTDGDFEHWSSRFLVEQPLITFVSDLDRACEIAEDGDEPRLVIVDGSVSRKSASLARLSAASVSLLVLVPECDSESLEFLAKQHFTFWEWEDTDFTQLFWPSVDGANLPDSLAGYEHRVRQVRSQPPVVKSIECPAADAAFQSILDLEKLHNRRGEDKLTEVEELIARAYVAMLRMLQSVGTPPAYQPSQVVGAYLTQEERTAVREMEQAIARCHEALSAHNGKAEALAELMRQYPNARVICRDPTKAAQLGTDILGESGSSVGCAECDHDWDSPAIVIGWLGRPKMARLLKPPVGNPLVLLLYGVEQGWYDSLTKSFARQKSHRSRQARRSLIFRESVGWRRKDPSEVVPTDEPETPSILPTLDEFQRRAVESRRRRALEQAQANGQEPEVEARSVFFADGSYAFLTEVYEAKVVTHLLGSVPVTNESKAEVHLRDVESLRAGDVLIFMRGSDRDAIREVADRRLPQNMRATARLWQDAMRRYQKKNGFDVTDVWKQLRKAGCTHHRGTVRVWIESDTIIAPRDAHDHELKIIADVTQDAELKRRFAECDQAITTVWGAHLSASCHLAEQVLARATERLAAGIDAANLIEIEPGVVLATIDEVQNEVVTVRRGSTNRLLEGNLWQG